VELIIIKMYHKQELDLVSGRTVQVLSRYIKAKHQQSFMKEWKLVEQMHSNFGGGQTQTFSSGGGGNQVYTLKLAPQTQALATTSQIGNLPAVGSSFGGGQLSVGGLALANIAGVGALGLQNISSTGNIGVGKITGTLAPPQLLSKIGTTSVVAQAQPQSITSGSASKLISLSGIGSAITGIGSGVTAFGLKPLGFGFPRIGGGVGNPRSRKIKTKAKYGYTPDYTSLVTGRKGKQPQLNLVESLQDLKQDLLQLHGLVS